MNSPLYAVLAAHYPRKPRAPKDGGIDGPMLYNSIGHPEYADHPLMQNTCAVRLSMALLGAGIEPVPGHMTIKAGEFKGKRIEQSQKLLAEFLKKRFGQPEVYMGGREAIKGIKERRGIISFFSLHGGTDTQGHIDLVEPATAGGLQCASSCYFTAREVWFWPLK